MDSSTRVAGVDGTRGDVGAGSRFLASGYEFHRCYRCPLRRWHRPLLVSTGAMGVLTLFSLVAMAVDERQLLGESVWLKPFKFGLAFLLYSGTLAWLLSLPHKGSRATWWMGTVFAVTGFVDVGFIVLQAARGTFSHFNADHTDRVNDIGQIVFASGVPGLFVANLVIVLVLAWQRILDRPATRAIHAGLALAVAGMALGYLMGFTGEQTARDADGRPVPLAAGHTVTHTPDPLRDGGDTMPLTHWSTHGGDLRVPHFAGLHAIQVLLAAAVVLAWLARRHPWLTERVRARIVGVLRDRLRRSARGTAAAGPARRAAATPRPGHGPHRGRTDRDRYRRGPGHHAACPPRGPRRDRVAPHREPTTAAADSRAVTIGDAADSGLLPGRSREPVSEDVRRPW